MLDPHRMVGGNAVEQVSRHRTTVALVVPGGADPGGDRP